MKKHTYKIIVLVLVIVIACMVFFRGNIMEYVGESEVRVDTLEVKDESLALKVEEYEKALPALEATVDSLLSVVEARDKKIIDIHTTYADKVEIIKNNDVCEDMEFYGEYLPVRDTLPELLRIDGKSVVVISKKQLKETNLIFASHDAYAQERPVLLANIDDLELAVLKQQAINDTLSVVVLTQKERIEVNKDIIFEKDEQIKQHKKKGRRRMASILTISAVAIGGTILILK